MPAWTPTEEWTGTDAFIIGGGPSLKGFDFSRLQGRNVIGCNSAFTLGHRVCSLCFFSDPAWFYHFENELEGFPGRVVTHSEEFPVDHPWVFTMRRELDGLHRNAIGFGGNSGCGAINLALILGAKRVFLLGFDCHLGDKGEPNWHDRTIEAPKSEVYLRFIEGFYAIYRDLPHVFPGREVINCTLGSSLAMFPFAQFDNIIGDNAA